MEAPAVRIEPPGPRAREILGKDSEILMQSFVRWYPLVVKTGKGVVVEDVDGNKYLDFNSGLAVMNVGHNHPRVVESIKRQAEKLLHYSLTDFYYEEAVRVGEKIKGIMPFTGDSRLFYANSGAETVEGAVKIARGHFRGSRQYIIGFLGAFHGRTMGAVSITASKPVQRKWFSPLVPGVIHVPYPYSYRCPFKAETPEECGEAVIGYIEDWILSKLVDPSEVAAFILEPIQGEGGYIVPPDNFLPKLRTLSRRHGILLIVDEVQSGIGRTGRWYAVEHWGVEPDILTSAKGIASGLPLGVIGGRKEVMDLPAGSHASTFGGNPVSLAAAEAVIDVIREEKLLDNATRVGEHIMKRLNEMSDYIELIGEVRGKGLMIGVELVRDKYTKEPARKEMAWIINNAFKRGLLIISAGVSTLRIAPPLIITEEEADAGLDIIESLLKEAVKLSV
ncbi:MAG: acetyl ornithine aminotransferase family protein [Desulfurococcales archaeon]|nr:acetyl ornithine aminotransferase family protein [Desulfurococcales archaeon]